MKAISVIGAGFGDEGKGMVTNFFSRIHRKSCIVIRSNGGCQAGHSVVIDGKHRVYSHVGAGDLYAPTYLSKYFVVNPMLFLKECETFDNPLNKVFIDSECMITTPYDMIHNQITEIRRGHSRHGSCGVGFGSTIERDGLIPLRFSDMLDHERFIDRLEDIRDWVQSDLKDQISQREQFIYKILKSNTTSHLFLSMVKYFLTRVRVLDETILNQYETLIFEGAQGLELDQEYGSFPHVTRSNTGSKNIESILSRLESNDTDHTAYYVSRVYKTRHGAGPLPNEFKTVVPFHISEPTNIFNDFQGAIRYAPLDVDELNAAISWDQQFQFPGSQTNRIMTCLDQIPNSHSPIILNGRHTLLSRRKMFEVLYDLFDIGFDNPLGIPSHIGAL